MSFSKASNFKYYFNLFLFIGLLFYTSCKKTSPTIQEPLIVEPPVVIEPDTIDGLKFLALGDSYTIGQGVLSSSTWPKQLVDQLANSDYIFSVPKIIAKTGWTTTQLTQAIEEEENLIEYDLVSLSIGVNNQYQNMPFNIFETEFNSLLDTAIELSDTQYVFIVSIPDYGVTPFGEYYSETIAEELDIYNAYMENVSAQYNIPFVDITTISRQLGSGSNALADDQLHPSAYQYSKWVDEILPIVLNLLEE